MMKTKLNVVFFSICLMASILTELYILIAHKGDMVSAIGIGVVILIMTYLTLDAIRDYVNVERQKIKDILNEMHLANKESENENYAYLINIQKASYSAMKKHSAIMEEELQKIRSLLEKLDEENSKPHESMLMLQRKTLEAIKATLNIEVTHGKENTNRMIRIMQEEIHSLGSMKQQSALEKAVDSQSGKKPDTEQFDTKVIEEAVEFLEEKNQNKEDSFSENNLIEIPLIYEDPNKALSPDEIATLFSTYGQ